MRHQYQVIMLASTGEDRSPCVKREGEPPMAIVLNPTETLAIRHHNKGSTDSLYMHGRQKRITKVVMGRGERFRASN